MAWQFDMETLSDGRIQRYMIKDNEGTLSFSQVLSLWGDDALFRSYFMTLLIDCPFSAYRWETPAVTTASVDRDFEFVLLRSESLERTVDTSAFSAYFKSKSEVVTFSNLGGDAVLVVPCPISDTSIYGHLASFIRHAPESQRQLLWHSTAIAMRQRISERPVWLSTAGMGVSWLHVRLDDRPKYYGYAPFRLQ